MIPVTLGKRERESRWHMEFTDAQGREQRIGAHASRKRSEVSRLVLQDLVNADVTGGPAPLLLRYQLAELPAASLKRLIELGLLSEEQVRLGERLVDELPRYARSRVQGGVAAPKAREENNDLAALFRALDWHVWEDADDLRLRQWFASVPKYGPRWI